jgi:hypothetical protein
MFNELKQQRPMFNELKQLLKQISFGSFEVGEFGYCKKYTSAPSEIKCVGFNGLLFEALRADLIKINEKLQQGQGNVSSYSPLRNGKVVDLSAIEKDPRIVPLLTRVPANEVGFVNPQICTFYLHPETVLHEDYVAKIKRAKYWHLNEISIPAIKALIDYKVGDHIVALDVDGKYSEVQLTEEMVKENTFIRVNIGLSE